MHFGSCESHDDADDYDDMLTLAAETVVDELKRIRARC